jgi:hypothetical protein
MKASVEPGHDEQRDEEETRQRLDKSAKAVNTTQ